MTVSASRDRGTLVSWRSLVLGIGLALPLALGGPVQANTAPAVGQPAPAFSAKDSKGQVHTLQSFRGSVVVLEWTNHECPFVQKHYEAGAMQALQKDSTSQGVVWLSVISSAPGEQGFVGGADADTLTQSRKAAPTAVLLDPEGNVGKSYAAKTTPHMYIIDAQGTLAYMGAIDDQPNTSGDPAKARNYVREALAEVKAGKPVTTASTRAYGCSVKYAN
jgi:peroxiredoxin